jgi:hypothetical protein
MTIITRLRIAALDVSCGWSDLDLGHGFHATKQGGSFRSSRYIHIQERHL